MSAANTPHLHGFDPRIDTAEAFKQRLRRAIDALSTAQASGRDVSADRARLVGLLEQAQTAVSQLNPLATPSPQDYGKAQEQGARQGEVISGYQMQAGPLARIRQLFEGGRSEFGSLRGAMGALFGHVARELLREMDAAPRGTTLTRGDVRQSLELKEKLREAKELRAGPARDIAVAQAEAALKPVLDRIKERTGQSAEKPPNPNLVGHDRYSLEQALRTGTNWPYSVEQRVREVLQARQDVRVTVGRGEVGRTMMLPVAVLNDLLYALRMANGDPRRIQVSGEAATDPRVREMFATFMREASEFPGQLNKALVVKEEIRSQVARASGRADIGHPAVHASVQDVVGRMTVGELEAGLRQLASGGGRQAQDARGLLVRYDAAMSKLSAQAAEDRKSDKANVPEQYRTVQSTVAINMLRDRVAMERAHAHEQNKAVHELHAELSKIASSVGPGASEFEIKSALDRAQKVAIKLNSLSSSELASLGEEQALTAALAQVNMAMAAYGEYGGASGEARGLTGQEQLTLRGAVKGKGREMGEIPARPGDYVLTHGKRRGDSIKGLYPGYLRWLANGALEGSKEPTNVGEHEVKATAGASTRKGYEASVEAARRYLATHEGQALMEREYSAGMLADDIGPTKAGLSQEEKLRQRSERSREALRTTGGPRTVSDRRHQQLQELRRQLTRIDSEVVPNDSHFEANVREATKGRAGLVARIAKLEQYISSRTSGSPRTSVHGADSNFARNAQAHAVYLDRYNKVMAEAGSAGGHEAIRAARRSAEAARDQYLVREAALDDAARRGMSPEETDGHVNRALKQADLEGRWRTPEAVSADLRNDSHTKDEARKAHDKGLEEQEGDLWRRAFARDNPEELLRLASAKNPDGGRPGERLLDVKSLTYQEQQEAQSVLSRMRARYDPRWVPSEQFRRGAYDLNELEQTMKTGREGSGPYVLLEKFVEEARLARESGDTFARKRGMGMEDILGTDDEVGTSDVKLIRGGETLEQRRQRHLDRRSDFKRLYFEEADLPVADVEHYTRGKWMMSWALEPGDHARTPEQMQKYIDRLTWEKRADDTRAAAGMHSDVSLSGVPQMQESFDAGEVDVAYDRFGRLKAHYLSHPNPNVRDAWAEIEVTTERLDWEHHQASAPTRGLAPQQPPYEATAEERGEMDSLASDTEASLTHRATNQQINAALAGVQGIKGPADPDNPGHMGGYSYGPAGSVEAVEGQDATHGRSYALPKGVRDERAAQRRGELP